MNNILDASTKREQFWPTIASLVIPVVQLLAVIVVDINDTLKLRELFLKPEVLPAANLLTLMLIAAGIGVYWYWKENFNWFNTAQNSTKPIFHQQKIRNFLLQSGVAALITCILIIVSLVLGKSTSEEMLRYYDLIAITQIVSYIVFVSIIGIIVYIGLSEYFKKQKDFKPEQYLTNLISAMQNYGTIPRPRIHIKEQRILQDNRLSILVNLTIGDEEKYLITSYNGKEISKELSAAEYRQAVTQQPTQQ